MSESLTLPPAPLTIAQRRRREANSRRVKERQALYPKGIVRESPRKLFPYVPNTRSVRVVMEHPTKHPNDFLYLLQFSQEETDVTAYAWFYPSGTPYRQSPANPQGKLYPSIVSAVEELLRAGWLDTSW